MELAIAAASGAMATVTAVVCCFILGRRASDAERRAGESAVKASGLDGKLLAATLSADQWKAKALDLEKTNAKLTDLAAEAVDNLPPDGARARLHAKWFKASVPVAATTDLVVQVPLESEDSDPDGVIDPFDRG